MLWVRRLSVLVGLIGGLGALTSSAAQASAISLGACKLSPLSQPFTPWADPASYELAPGGDFERAVWRLKHGAQLVAGSEPFEATGVPGLSSLSLPDGGSAQSPSTCVNAAYPSLRFFISGSGSVLVQVLYEGTAIPAGVAVAGQCWQPSPIMLTQGAITGALSGGTARVSLRLTAISGHPLVDDLFIDPWNRT